MTYVEIAKLCHKINKEYCLSMGDDTQVDWDAAPEWQKESAIKGVEYHMANTNIKPSDSHDNWYKQKVKDGWKYGPIKDAEKKEHPCMVVYEALPMQQRSKDHIFKAICDFFRPTTQ